MPKNSDTRLRDIALSGVERHSEWLRTSSQQIAQYAKMLVDRPKYETKAEGALDDAEKALVSALDQVRTTKAVIAALKMDA